MILAPSPTLRPTQSTVTSGSSRTPSLLPGVKLAPPIQQVSIIAEEKRSDQKLWYILKVTPQRMNMRVVNGYSVSQKSARQPYLVARRYDDFCLFAQQLHETFPPSLPHCSASMSSRAGSRLRTMSMTTQEASAVPLPKLNGKRLHLLHSKKQMYLQRRAELDAFLQSLFALPPSVSQSLIVLEFFGLHKVDTQEQELREQQQLARLTRSNSSTTQAYADPYSAHLRKSMSHPDLIHSSDSRYAPLAMPPTPTIHPLDTSKAAMGGPLWKRLRSRTPRSPPHPQPTASSSSLTTLCSQAASRMMTWNKTHTQKHLTRSPSFEPQPVLSISTPNAMLPQMHPAQVSTTHYYPRSRKGLVTSSSIISSSSSSSTSSRDSQSTCATSIAPSPTMSPTRHTIKMKIIYDVDNIIVIQVPRTTSLSELRTRITQKFSDPAIRLPKDFVLLFNDTRSSASSATSAASSFSVDSTSGAATLIAKERDLATLMETTWVRLEKVTLRCIA